jgi:ferredoxin-NADP reductase
VHLVASFRRAEEVIYGDALLDAADATVVLTREGGARRMNADDLAPHVRPGATVYVCGSARFARAASDLAIAAGVDPQAIRVERFGPSG